MYIIDCMTSDRINNGLVEVTNVSQRDLRPLLSSRSSGTTDNRPWTRFARDWRRPGARDLQKEMAPLYTEK